MNNHHYPMAFLWFSHSKWCFPIVSHSCKATDLENIIEHHRLCLAKIHVVMSRILTIRDVLAILTTGRDDGTMC